MKVTTDQTCDFAEHWRYNGVFVQQSPANIQFACDWANIVLVNFIEFMAEKQKQKKAAAAASAGPPKPTIVLTGEDS